MNIRTICARAAHSHLTLSSPSFDEKFQFFTSSTDNASNIAKSWMNRRVQKSGGQKNQKNRTKFHRLRVQCVVITSTLICWNSSTPSIDNTSIRFIIQCFIVYLRLVFGCWHIDALLLFHICQCTHSLTHTLIRVFGSVPFFPCMHFAFCIDKQWIG